MLRFARDDYDRIVARARRGRPEEVCGILSGRRADASRVVAVHHTDNVAADPRTAYEIAPTEQLAVMEAIEDAGREVVGFYHSHPRGPDRPSETDIAEATWPGYAYVVVSLGGDAPSVGSWRWTGDEFEREAVAVGEA